LFVLPAERRSRRQLLTNRNGVPAAQIPTGTPFRCVPAHLHPCSRSCILRSLKSRRRTAYHYVITLALYLKYPKKYPAKPLKTCSRQPRCHLTPFPGTSANIRINLIPLENRDIRVHFCRRQYASIVIPIFVVQSPSSASFLQQSAYRPFKVIQGQWHSRGGHGCMSPVIAGN